MAGARPFWENDPVVDVAPAKAANGAKPFWESDPVVEAEAPSALKETAIDVAKAVPSGLAKGTAGLMGLPGVIEDMADWTYRQTAGRASNLIRSGGKDYSAPTYEQQQERMGNPGRSVASPKETTAALESVTGPLYQPKTTAGQYAGTIAEFLPGMALPGGTLMQRGALAVGSAIGSETGGQIARQVAPEYEGYARLGGALVGGFGVTGAQLAVRRPSETLLREAAGPALTNQVVDRAEQLMMEAANRGLRLTWDEALNQASNGAVNLGGIRSGAQSRLEGAAIANRFMADRPEQIENAARAQFAEIAPQAPPSSVGRAVGTAAEETIDGVRQNINRLSEPYYTSAERTPLSQPDFARVQALPGYAAARDAVLNEPQLARLVQGLPENSVGFLNQVKQQLDTAAENARGAFNPQRNQTVAAGIGRDATAVRQAAQDAAPDYRTALEIQAQGRERVLQPLMDGPLGRLANRDQTTKQAIDALFPANPIDGSAAEITRAMNALARQNPDAARQLVRAHAATVFNEAAQNLQGGLNVYGGANFAAKLAGNSQQAQNLEAAVRALPQGDQTWNGFRRFLDVLEATGKNPTMGSNTANKVAIQEAMKSGQLSSELGNMILTGGLKVPGRVRSWYEAVQSGRNSEQLVNILLDPASAPLFRTIARENVGPSTLGGVVTRLTFMGERSLAERPSQPSR